MRVSIDQSRAFAALSGDFNPQHIDPISARRFIFGRTIVHGIQLVTLALDNALASVQENRSLVSLKAAFSQSIPTDSPFTFEILEASPASTTVDVKLDGATAASIEFAWTPHHSATLCAGLPDGPFLPSSPIEQQIEGVTSLER